MVAKKHKRVRWKIRRVASGWQPLVLLGEEPVYLPPQNAKSLAREVARTYANNIRNAGV